MCTRCLVCSGSLAGALVIAITIWMTCAIVTSERTAPASWARCRSGSPAANRAARQLWKSGGVAFEIVEQLVGQRLLGRHVGDDAVEPAVQGLPRIAAVELRRRVADLGHLVDVERLEQRLARGEVAVERADADARAARDLLQRGALAALGEGLARGREHLLVVAARVGALGAR